MGKPRPRGIPHTQQFPGGASLMLTYFLIIPKRKHSAVRIAPALGEGVGYLDLAPWHCTGCVIRLPRHFNHILEEF